MDIFTPEEHDKIVQAISLAENTTSGEIRLVVERRPGTQSAMERAIHYFEKLKMHNTVLRNGVLIYLAVDAHQFAIIGDQGINERVETDFWQCTKDKMLELFKEDKIAAGLIAGIQNAGERLQLFYPKRDDDINELPDDIYYGNN